eukprot:31032-Pelagococcus_subviridis.AAC.27
MSSRSFDVADVVVESSFSGVDDARAAPRRVVDDDDDDDEAASTAARTLRSVPSLNATNRFTRTRSVAHRGDGFDAYTLIATMPFSAIPSGDTLGSSSAFSACASSS